MTTKQLAISLFVLALWLYGNPTFAAQGCCSTHGGVAGCAGPRLLCKDGTLSPTCSCQDAPNLAAPQTRSKLAFLETTTVEVKPNVTPIPADITLPQKP